LHLKNKLNSGSTTLGSWITLGHSSIAEIMANSGFDWLAIDLEHTTISLKEAEDLIRIISLSGTTPLVRLTSNNKDQIKRILDSGAEGLIIPMINSYEDAIKAIDYAYYPPKGSRSFGLARAQGYGINFDKHILQNKENTVIVVQIEHIDALKDLKKILSIPEVDAYMIGPYDLSGSMGIPGEFNNPKFLEVIEEINKIGINTNTPSGIHVVEPDREKLREALKKYKFIAYSVDTRMLDTSCRLALEEF